MAQTTATIRAHVSIDLVASLVTVTVGSLAMELSAKVLCPDTVMKMRFKHCG